MSLFSRVVFAEEFVIDQKPEPVFAASGEEALFAESDDLLTALSEMVRSQEQLRELNQELRTNAKGGPDSLDKFLKRFLARLDGFDRILDAFRSMEPTAEVTNWLRSLEGLYYKMQADLKNVGLIPVETVGKKVDLERMEVIDYRPRSDYPHNTVIQELKRGYIYRGKVLRDAQVVVAYSERG
jgi:molecular chaperone GrpE